jgi:hypothetical protein
MTFQSRSGIETFAGFTENPLDMSGYGASG